MFRQGPASDGVVEHSAHGHAVAGGTLDAEADDAAGEDIDDHQHPMTVQEDRFAAEEVDTPEAIRRLGDEGQPKCGLRRFSAMMAAMRSADGPFGPGLRRGEGEEEAIDGSEIGRPLPAAIADEQLLLE